MGRRKIEIQPITHERNRSVTFVKRKNGLFKKAYELGVLCSVDVAVIIFEERAGHHLKLYQYCSSDIHDIVQRHLRHDGEKDTRGPADFSGNPTNKLDDLGEGDDDDPDDDDIHRVGKRRSDGGIKSGDSPVGVDLGYSPTLHRNMPIPAPPISLHGLPQSGGNTSSLPVSSDRHSVARSANAPPSKKPRMAEGISIPIHSESSSDDAVASASSNASGTYPYVSPTAASGFRHSSQGQYGNAFFPNVSTPSPSFNVPNSFDAFNSSRGQRNSGGSTGPANYPPRSTSYDAALYPHMVRQPNSSHGSASGAGGGGGEIFSFLDTESSHSRQHPSSGSNSNFTGMDWPVHSGGHNSAPPGSGGHPSSGHHSPSSGDTNTWLDFLTANPVAGGGSGGATSAVPNPSATGANGRRSSDAMSWERSSGRTGSTMGSPLSRSMTALGGVGGSAKRPRMGSGSGGEDDTQTAPASGGNTGSGRSNGIGSGITRADITIKQEKDGGG